MFLHSLIISAILSMSPDSAVRMAAIYSIGDFAIRGCMRFIKSVSLKRFKKFPKFIGEFLSLSIGYDAFGKFFVLGGHFLGYFFADSIAEFVCFFPAISGKLDGAE